MCVSVFNELLTIVQRLILKLAKKRYIGDEDGPNDRVYVGV